MDNKKNINIVLGNKPKVSMLLSYNETKRSISAIPKTVVDGVEIPSKAITKLDQIEALLHALSRQEKKSIEELVNLGIITFSDERLKDLGVIISDKEKVYKKVVLDTKTGKFNDKTLNRRERAALGLRHVDDTLEEDIVDDALDVGAHEAVERDTVIVPEPVVPPVEEETTIIPEPVAVPVDSDTTREVVDSEHTIEEDGAHEVVGETVSEETTDEVEEHRHRINGRTVIKGLKIGAGALAIILGGVILVHNFGNIFKSKSGVDNGSTNDDDNKQRAEDSMDGGMPSSAPLPFEEGYNESDNTVYINTDIYEYGKYQEYGSEMAGEDMKTQLDLIDAICRTYEPCEFSNLVIDRDKQALSIIDVARNEALNNRSRESITYIIDQYVKYIFEDSTMFDGNVIKGYQYLSPYARYIVLVSGETMLQLCRDYNYSTYNREYYFDSLIDEFDDLVDSTTRELLVADKIR